MVNKIGISCHSSRKDGQSLYKEVHVRGLVCNGAPE
uniref:Uncharacterized protein n=1 Tax=Anguilla anguilla TaxID=7936 RepID=A0A0E9Q7R1_ANGAN